MRCQTCLRPLIDFEHNFCSDECRRISFESHLKVQEAFAKDKAYCYLCGECKVKGCEHFPKV